jgi:hypothetical protein
VAQDLVEAYWWVHLAAVHSSDSQQARYAEALDELAAQMTPAQAEQRKLRIQQWSERFERRSRK